jgi:hypothetical protein
VQATVKVDGLALLNRNLRRLNADYPRRVKDIHQRIAEPVADLASRKVRSRSGRLAGSIRAVGTQRVARAQTGRLIYAPINHYGGYPGAYGGNPFLTDALEERHLSVVSIYTRELGALIEEVWIDNF